MKLKFKKGIGFYNRKCESYEDDISICARGLAHFKLIPMLEENEPETLTLRIVKKNPKKKGFKKFTLTPTYFNQRYAVNAADGVGSMEDEDNCQFTTISSAAIARVLNQFIDPQGQITLWLKVI